jgi:hypothetical protein
MKETTLMLAMTALRLLRHKPAVWPSLLSKLPQAVQILIEGEGDFSKWKASSRALCHALLTQPAGPGEDETNKYRAVHTVFVFAAQTVTRASLT